MPITMQVTEQLLKDALWAFLSIILASIMLWVGTGSLFLMFTSIFQLVVRHCCRHRRCCAVVALYALQLPRCSDAESPLMCMNVQAAFPIGWLIYSTPLDWKYFNFIHFLAPFVILGIGLDDIFVYASFYKDTCALIYQDTCDVSSDSRQCKKKQQPFLKSR